VNLLQTQAPYTHHTQARGNFELARLHQATERIAQMVVQATLSETQVDELRTRMRGTLLQPVDYEYDAVRTIWNAMIDRKPALIARCVSGADVIAALQFGREHDMNITIRGGGHNVSGTCISDDGLMIDLSPMKGIRIDPDSRTARVEPGVVWGEFDQEAQAFGLATVGGTVAHTGVAGLTLGGGFGWLINKHGMTIDNLISADVVTADGQLLHASETENPDLFWALRGAGANFGIVTSFEFQLHPVGPQILGGMVLYPLDQLKDVLRFYRELVTHIPDELTVYAAALTTPDGHKVAAIAACYCGDLQEGERVIAPIREFGKPIVDLIGPTTYLEQQAILTQGFPFGRQNYWKAGLSRTLSDAAIDAIDWHAPHVPSPYTATVIAGNAGANSRVAPDATAYVHRDATFNAMILSSWEEPADSDWNIEWTRNLHADLRPHLTGGVYVNDLDDPAEEGKARLYEAYGSNYDRLVELKTKYDPDNVFCHNHNIEPVRTEAPIQD
jgi:FAD/FMN-containing dehydrogenase